MNSQDNKRPSWDEYFIDIMLKVGERATCNRGKSGALITKDNRILSTGYVGSPSGIDHCDDVGHEMHTVINDDGKESQHCIRTTHAEQNALVSAARHGVSVNGGTVYCKMTPCYTCAKLIITAGIKRVVAFNDYQKAVRTKEIFKKADVELTLINNKEQKYE